MSQALVGIIGGSGLYQMDAMQDAQAHTLTTPFGAPSDALVTGNVHGVPVAFLARHARGHRLLPSEVPYRANIHAMKQLGVRYLLSVSAVGSLREAFKPLDMVLPDQFIDLTKQRESTFFGRGAVAHVSMAQPVCPLVAALLAQAVRTVLLNEPASHGITLHEGGTYVCIEGPQFSSQAESMWYRSMGSSVIGMTNMPEAKLAREAELCYATVAMVTDYDCWHTGHEAVTVEAVIAVMQANADAARRLVGAAIPRLGAPRGPCPAGCDRALEHAIVTAPGQRDPALLARLDAVAGRVL